MLKITFVFFKNSLISILFFPLIYFLGWFLINILSYFFPVLNAEKSLYGTIFTFLFFIILLPNWSKNRWNKDFFEIIGFIKLRNKKFLLNLFIEFFKAFSLILLITIILLLGDFSQINFSLNIPLFCNIIFLGMIVGFAEELVFRVWLFEELSIFLVRKNANLLQAIIFAIVHIRSDYDLLSNLQIFIGLFLLGLYLNNWRIHKNPSILLPICFHGSLVSVWFFVSSSILEINADIPKLFFGPGEGNNLNPIGGFVGMLMLSMLIVFQYQSVNKNYFRNPNNKNNINSYLK